MTIIPTSNPKLSHSQSLLHRANHLLNSNTLQTVVTVCFIVFMSVSLSLWLFYRSLYLPELKNHASYLASELKFMEAAVETFSDDTEKLQWLYKYSHIERVDDPSQFPVVSDKIIADFFTDSFARQVSTELGRNVRVYFKFKPTPILWVQDSQHPHIWYREPVIHYLQYNMGLLISFVLGLPILTIIVILLLVRRLNRPLKKLERAATDYINLGHATILPTHTGSNEIKKVNTAFNQLFATLAQTQKERTIMLAGISHDLRTPLTRMRLTAEMLPDEFFREGLILDIEDMDAILEQFISFMKDGSDEAVRLTNLHTIFHEIMVQFNDVKFIYDNQVTKDVVVRPLSIKRLIINLVNNAIRYGRTPIHLSAHITPASDTQPYDMLALSVEDEGDGVAESELERIMQPFERGETARTTQGSGLGLAIVARICELHHGRVSAYNRDGGGLVVTVHIPLITQVLSLSDTQYAKPIT